MTTFQYPTSQGRLEKPERTIVIGDVHGCFNELVSLINLLKLADNDLLIFVGDLLHKGPNSGQVVQYVMELAKQYHVVLVWGNHEEKHIRWLHHEKLFLETGKANPTRHVEEYPATQKQLTDEHVAFLRGEIYPVYTYYRFPGHIVAHGGIPGCLRELPSEQSLTVSNINYLGKRIKYKLKQLYRIRYEDDTGHMVAMGEEQPEHHYWAETYDGRFGTCIFGHQPFNGVGVFPHAYGIDTGCVYGGCLTAYVHNTSDSSFEFLHVEAECIYQEQKQLMNRSPNKEKNNASSE